MPIEYLLYHPSEKKVLQKLRDNHIHDASLLNYLSRDHIHILGLTKYDCFKLEKVAERDALRGPLDYFEDGERSAPLGPPGRMVP
uniref:Uncharacterized protein n=1 Tax=Moniliophthora roreri TaxID=221103 RepID=A0A0W0EW38_MONRR